MGKKSMECDFFQRWREMKDKDGNKGIMPLYKALGFKTAQTCASVIREIDPH